ncbi:aminotransferase class I/II-fold pyridoxal phosphate-dependent enzyme [Anaerotignum faecicola]|nr:aminotransferase class I/II-fold pyridoxal phosphate-dependent enzyme [Anaerotignum faecicola]
MENLIHQHGGDLDAIERRYGIPKKEIVDFSGNINPLGFPESVKKELAENLDIVSSYPDKNYTALKKSISQYTGADSENIFVGNGSTELINIFITSVNAKKAVILGPAYSEYENSLKKCGSEFEYFPLEESRGFVIDTEKLLSYLTDGTDLFVACNPNNPTGTAINAVQMDKILLHCKKHNISVMVDETYIEFSDNINEICSIPLTNKYDNLFVIRGVSKFFAAPGLRLGYGITSSAGFKKLISENQDPWSVNILASFAGERLFGDKDFAEKTKLLISSERRKALDEFRTWKNLKAYDSSSNFILLKLLTDKITSAEIFENLIQKKYLIRDAETFTFLDNTYLRFCILTPQQNCGLIKELKALIED